MNRNIHQIWVGPEIPQRFIDRSKHIENLNPLYEMRRWDEESLVKEFPCIQQFIDLDCPGTFISNYARIRILHKYGGWYIDYDFEGSDSLEDIFNEYLPIMTAEFYMPGYENQSGFIYFDKDYDMGILMDYLPDEPIMPLFNEFMTTKEYNLIPSELVSNKGTAYKEERMRSFYLHPNFNNRLVFDEKTKKYTYIHKDKK